MGYECQLVWLSVHFSDISHQMWYVACVMLANTLNVSTVGLCDDYL